LPEPEAVMVRRPPVRGSSAPSRKRRRDDFTAASIPRAFGASLPQVGYYCWQQQVVRRRPFPVERDRRSEPRRRSVHGTGSNQRAWARTARLRELFERDRPIGPSQPIWRYALQASRDNGVQFDPMNKPATISLGFTIDIRGSVAVGQRCRPADVPIMRLERMHGQRAEHPRRNMIAKKRVERAV